MEQKSISESVLKEYEPSGDERFNIKRVNGSVAKDKCYVIEAKYPTIVLTLGLLWSTADS